METLTNNILQEDIEYISTKKEKEILQKYFTVKSVVFRVVRVSSIAKDLWWQENCFSNQTM